MHLVFLNKEIRTDDPGFKKYRRTSVDITCMPKKHRVCGCLLSPMWTESGKAQPFRSPWAKRNGDGCAITVGPEAKLEVERERQY